MTRATFYGMKKTMQLAHEASASPGGTRQSYKDDMCRKVFNEIEEIAAALGVSQKAVDLAKDNFAAGLPQRVRAFEGEDGRCGRVLGVG